MPLQLHGNGRDLTAQGDGIGGRDLEDPGGPARALEEFVVEREALTP
jgi:hypothetical protein